MSSILSSNADSVTRSTLPVIPADDNKTVEFEHEGEAYSFTVRAHAVGYSLTPEQWEVVKKQFEAHFKEQLDRAKKMEAVVSKIEVKMNSKETLVEINGKTVLNNNLDKLKTIRDSIFSSLPMRGADYLHGSAAPTFPSMRERHDSLDSAPPNSPLLSTSKRSSISQMSELGSDEDLEERGSRSQTSSVENSSTSSVPYIETQGMRHSILSESKQYVSDFIDCLIEKSPDKKEELQLLKERTIAQLMGRYDSKKKEFYSHVSTSHESHALISHERVKSHYDEEWAKAVTDEAKQQEIKEAWSKDQELGRQKKAGKLLLKAIYAALAIAIKDPEQAGKLHTDICLMIAKKRGEEIQVGGKIALDLAPHQVTMEDRKEMTMQRELRQYAKRVTSSMEKRKAKEDGKYYGVNLHAETITFQIPGKNRSVRTTQLRSGSFDFIPPDNQEQIKVELAGKYRPKPLERGVVDEEIRQARIADDPQQIYDLIENLKIYYVENPSPHNLAYFKEWIPKLERELDQKIRDFEIMKISQSVIENIFDQTSSNTDPDSDLRLGMELPEVVRNHVLSGMIGLEAHKDNWGMVSLQTPLNFLSRKGINKIIPDPKSSIGLRRKAADPEYSELNTIYREEQAYQAAIKAKQGKRDEEGRTIVEGAIGKGFYFNVATNAMAGISNLFNRGDVDKTRALKVAQVTQQSAAELHVIGAEALQRTDLALLQPGSMSSDQIQELERYRTSLKLLIEQTFERDKNGLINLKKPPSGSKYEIVARAVVLMQLLGMKTTGHCRSGNNRTAEWLAKTHQLVGEMVASEDGAIPPPELTATVTTDKMGGRIMNWVRNKVDRWSVEIFRGAFEISMNLQQANKGTRGTKQDVKEFGAKPLRKALTKGAFEIAGKFERNKFEKARKARVEAQSLLQVKNSPSSKGKKAQGFSEIPDIPQ